MTTAIIVEIEKIFNADFSIVLELIPPERKDMVIESVSLLSDAVKKYNESSGCCGRGARPAGAGDSADSQE